MVFLVLSSGVFTRIFSPLRLRENQRASFSVDRSNSWFSRTMSSDGTLHSPPMPFIHDSTVGMPLMVSTALTCPVDMTDV